MGTLNLFQVTFTLTVVFATAVNFFFCCWAGEYLVSQVTTLHKEFIFHIFMIEKINSKLIDFQSISVGHAVYDCKWYMLHHHDARSLILIGLQKFRPLTMTAGKFSVLSFNLFLNVSATSMYSACTMYFIICRRY